MDIFPTIRSLSFWKWRQEWRTVKALPFLHPFTSLSMTSLFSPFNEQELFRETGVWQLSLKENLKKKNSQNAKTIQIRVIKSRVPDSILEDLSTNLFWFFTHVRSRNLSYTLLLTCKTQSCKTLSSIQNESNRNMHNILDTAT